MRLSRGVPVIGAVSNREELPPISKVFILISRVQCAK